MKEVDRQSALTTPCHRIWSEGGLVYCETLQGANVSLEDARLSIDSIASIADGEKPKVVSLIQEMGSITGDARRYYASDAVAAVVSAQALVVRSPVSRMIGNFFLGLNKPVYPTRLFGDARSAAGWLQQLPE